MAEITWWMCFPMTSVLELGARTEKSSHLLKLGRQGKAAENRVLELSGTLNDRWQHQPYL